jgi:DNA-binding transcriptional LysR family regulator
VPVPEDRHPPTFRLLVVPGVTVDRWSRTWSERVPGVELRLVPAEVTQAEEILAGQADAGLLRLPVDRDTLDAIPLYTEVTVAVVPREHTLAAADELTVADLVDETLLRPLDDVLTWPGPPAAIPATDRPATDRPATTAAAVELVAAGAGILVVPQSLARRYHRRDLTYRVVTDAPTSSVALVWLRERYTDLIEEMIGIVRGRTANSTRGRDQTPTASAAPTTRTSAEGRTPRPKPASGRTGARQGSPNPRRSSRRRGR